MILYTIGKEIRSITFRAFLNAPGNPTFFDITEQMIVLSKDNSRLNDIVVKIFKEREFKLNLKLNKSEKISKTTSSNSLLNFFRTNSRSNMSNETPRDIDSTNVDITGDSASLSNVGRLVKNFNSFSKE